MGSWWQGFFDRTYTDVWQAAGAFDHTQDEVAGLLALLGDRGLPADGALRILDVPCGFGRHAGPLHTHGHRVVGLDASADQIALARERHPGPAYVVGDMRQPPAGPFDVVLNLYSSFGYLGEAEDRRALRAWHDVLAPGGLLVIEGMHRDGMVRKLVGGEEFPLGSSGAVESGHVDWVAGIAYRTVRLPGGLERSFTLRTYSATEMVAMMAAAGFVDTAVVGGWQGEPFGPDSRLLLTAHRPTD